MMTETRSPGRDLRKYRVIILIFHFLISKSGLSGLSDEVTSMSLASIIMPYLYQYN